MTCIVGLVHNGTVYIGGDSAATDNDTNLSVRADAKVFRKGDFLIGFAHSFRAGQLLRYSLSPSKRFPDTDVYEYMVTTFIDAARQCLNSGGSATKESDREMGSVFMVGYEGRLFVVYSDYAVEEVTNSYNAIGCGMFFALGSLHATSKLEKLSPTSRLNMALEAAEFHNGAVRSPFTVLNTREA